MRSSNQSEVSERTLKQNRKTREEFRLRYLPDLLAEGYQVQRLTEFHYRINERVDVFPTNKRYTVRQGGKARIEGTYRWLGDLKTILRTTEGLKQRVPVCRRSPVPTGE